MSESAGRVTVERDGDLATVFLDHPSKLNVLDSAAWAALAATFEELGEDRDLRCLVVRGRGGRAFSAGSDIGHFPEQRSTPEDVARYGGLIREALHSVRHCLHPTVALIDGLCVGGGLEIAACCDLRVAGASSRFGAPINRLGLTMAYEELDPLVRLLGPGPVLDILLTGDLLDADAALRAGLVSRVFGDEVLAEEGMALARRVASGAPLVNRWHKRFIRRLEDGSAPGPDERLEAYEAFRTSDYREGTRAFLEKRAPRFEGR
ncbi:MAG: enoyl-CoA hydratase-related protein [Gemmatimonadota bacterium]|nr:enoyl-CoA hydratase-related protein [Gemmatimonadota bacterium]